MICSSALECVRCALSDDASLAVKVVSSATARVSKSDGVGSWSLEHFTNALLKVVL